MKNVLVTGADGFIGSHLTQRLLDQGINVEALALYNSFGSKGWLSDVEESNAKLKITFGDIRDRTLVKSLVKRKDTIFHLAALIGIPYSYIAPQSYIDVNITGTLNILEAVKEVDSIDHLICTSTSEVYGTAQYVPIDETHPLVGQSPYAATKIAADQLALSYFRSFSTPVSILRPFNTYGPRQSTRAVIPSIITQLINTDNLRLGSLDPTRDFNFVLDTVDAFIELAKTKDAIGNVYNAASEFEISINDTALTIAKILNKPINISTDNNRLRPKLSEVNRLFGNSQRLQSITSWQPQYSGIEGFTRGIEETIRWFEDPYNIKKYQSNSYQI